jgi:hypothetical protein
MKKDLRHSPKNAPLDSPAADLTSRRDELPHTFRIDRIGEDGINLRGSADDCSIRNRE